MAVLNFIINEIFGQGAIFISLIALVGLLLQKPMKRWFQPQL